MQNYDSSKNTAAYLGMSDSWLRLRRINGDGPPFYKVGRRTIRYKREEVDAWVLAQKRTNTTRNPYWP